MLSTRARTAASYAIAKLADRTVRLAHNLTEFSEGFALHAVHGAARSALTTQLYASYAYGKGDALHAWESSWLARGLPKPPARVLLGGAGRGRELQHLNAHGYGVHAFDPLPVAHTRCLQLSYEQLAAAVLSSGASAPEAARAVLDAAPFDAVLLGWGSLTHVLDERDQDALFLALDRLAPRAPILASFFMTSMQRKAAGRALSLGAAVGARLHALHDGPSQSILLGRVRCLSHSGFIYLFDRPRLQALADSINRRLELEENDYPRAIFWP